MDSVDFMMAALDSYPSVLGEWPHGHIENPSTAEFMRVWGALYDRRTWEAPTGVRMIDSRAMSRAEFTAYLMFQKAIYQNRVALQHGRAILPPIEE